MPTNFFLSDKSRMTMSSVVHGRRKPRSLRDLPAVIAPQPARIANYVAVSCIRDKKTNVTQPLPKTRKAGAIR
jgi:hypothetical protein